MNASASELFPHQRRLVEEYRGSRAPRAVGLDAPTGTGKSRALAAIVAERAARGSLAVVVVRPALLAQWSLQFKTLDLLRVAVFRSPADVRLAWSVAPTPWPTEGVILASSSLFRSPLAQKALDLLTPGILVVDDIAVSMDSQTGRALASVADRSANVIATTLRGPIPWYPQAERRTWGLALIGDDGRSLRSSFAVRVREFGGTRSEALLVSDSLHALADIGNPLTKLLLTRPAIQAALLAAIRRIDAPEQLGLWAEGQVELDFDESPALVGGRQVVESLWSLLDRFDELEPDGRLEATVAEVRAALADDRPSVVTTGGVRELDYVVAGLEGVDGEIASVTASTTQDDRAQALNVLRGGGVLIATPILFSMQVTLPDRTRSVWFAPPRSGVRAREQLGLGVATSGVEIVLLKATPAVTPADGVVDQLINFLREPWKDDDPGELDFGS